jgi:acetolactate synthase-1/2/3 large subunit
MKRTGAQIFWECLEREGVEVIFGYPGGVTLPIYDALVDSPIHHVKSVWLWLHPARAPRI